MIQDKNAVYALEVGDTGSRGGAPRRSWSARLQTECHDPEDFGFRAARSQRDADAARGLYDTAGDLQQMQADAGKLALPQRM